MEIKILKQLLPFHQNHLYQLCSALILIIICGYSVPLFADNSELKVPTSSPLIEGAFEYDRSDNVTNQIPYFDNRFRIDSELDEITLIFYRKRGSVPIILVQPDGAKIIINSYDMDNVEWYDDSTFDMIKIKKPMVGPWQAIGDILPESQILVVSDVKIVAEPLPNIIFSGETLKVTGQLFNAEQAIDSPTFREVVKLNVNFYSTNNTLYENFGADAIRIATFRDDGRDLDEYANDKVFTGEFVMKFASGEWQPVYIVKLPMATRELRQNPIMLHKTPISLSVDKSESDDTPHKINFIIDPNFVDVDTLDFQGKITFPDRKLQPFSIVEEEGNTRLLEVPNKKAGLYRINVRAFGKTLTGRDFLLEVPELSFNIAVNQPIAVSSTTIDGNKQVINKERELELEQERIAIIAAKQLEQEEKEAETLLIIVVTNVLVIITALIIFLLMRKAKKQS